MGTQTNTFLLGKGNGTINMLTLRPDQERVKRDIYRAIREGKTRVAVQAPTSFGKTALSAAIVHDALAKGLGVIFTAPMITLVDQTLAEFEKFGIYDIGVIQADHPLTDYSQPVQICSIQSIAALMKRNPEAWEEFQRGKLILHDECHVLHETHSVVNELADKPVIGISATPWRKGLGQHYDTLILGPSVGQLIEDGSLCPYRAYSHHEPDMEGVKTTGGDYSLSESGDKYDAKIVGSIVDTWRTQAEGKKTILFAPRVVDAERFAEEFRQAGVTAVAVSGYMDSDDCAVEIERFRQGEITVICSVAKLAVGFSVTSVECIIDAQPTKSLMRHVQKLGRGLRTHQGKDEVIILDNAGNLLRNGLPDGDFPAELNDGEGETSDRKKPEDPLPKPCPKCNFVKPPKVHECPACGFAPEKKSQVEVEAGELVEITGNTANRKTSWDDKIEFISQLKGYAQEKGYKAGWVAHQYRSKFGVFPNDKRVKYAKPGRPDDLVHGWIKYQTIKRRASA